jgi:hypothetical protein
MRVTAMCKALALHEIFDQNGIAAAGGALKLSEVEQAWQTFGLRRTDLRDTLADARASGEFALAEGPEGPQVVLTERGYEHAQRDLSTLSDIDELIQAFALLSFARRRKPRGVNYGRRKDDKLDS